MATTDGTWRAIDAGDESFPDHWNADPETRHEDSCSWKCVAEDDETVAVVVAHGWDDAKLDRRAALIAAAPDLLEALQDLLEACIREYGQPDDGEPDESVGWIKDRETGSSQPMPFTYGLMQRARAALSKALPAISKAGA